MGVRKMNFEEWRKNNENNIPFRPESENEFIDWLERAFNAAKPQWQQIETIIAYDNVLLSNGNRIEKGFLGECGFYAAYPICPSPKLDFNPTHWQPLPHPPVV